MKSCIPQIQQAPIMDPSDPGNGAASKAAGFPSDPEGALSSHGPCWNTTTFDGPLRAHRTHPTCVHHWLFLTSKKKSVRHLPQIKSQLMVVWGKDVQKPTRLPQVQLHHFTQVIKGFEIILNLSKILKCCQISSLGSWSSLQSRSTCRYTSPSVKRAFYSLVDILRISL